MWLSFHPAFQCCFVLEYESFIHLYESTLCLNGF